MYITLLMGHRRLQTLLIIELYAISGIIDEFIIYSVQITGRRNSWPSCPIMNRQFRNINLDAVGYSGTWNPIF